MACNTTSAIVYERLKDKYNFKVYPIIQSVAKQFSELPIKRIGIFATPATINSHCYKKELLKHYDKMEGGEIARPEWVRIVEDGHENTEFGRQAVELKMQEMLMFNPEKIVLGCTHYPYLIDILQKFAPKEMFINPSEEFAKIIRNDLVSKNLLNQSQTSGYEKFYVSANPEKFQKSASMFYEIKDLPVLTEFQPA